VEDALSAKLYIVHPGHFPQPISQREEVVMEEKGEEWWPGHSKSTADASEPTTKHKH
jgi:hypothetical protein